jgi:hypothetical protein
MYVYIYNLRHLGRVGGGGGDVLRGDAVEGTLARGGEPGGIIAFYTLYIYIYSSLYACTANVAPSHGAANLGALYYTYND